MHAPRDNLRKVSSTPSAEFARDLPDDARIVYADSEEDSDEMATDDSKSKPRKVSGTRKQETTSEISDNIEMISADSEEDSDEMALDDSELKPRKSPGARRSTLHDMRAMLSDSDEPEIELDDSEAELSEIPAIQEEEHADDLSEDLVAVTFDDDTLVDEALTLDEEPEGELPLVPKAKPSGRLTAKSVVSPDSQPALLDVPRRPRLEIPVITSGETKVLVNGKPATALACEEKVHQGKPVLCWTVTLESGETKKFFSPPAKVEMV